MGNKMIRIRKENLTQLFIPGCVYLLYTQIKETLLNLELIHPRSAQKDHPFWLLFQSSASMFLKKARHQ